ncbi:MAG: zf-HC2 domain-containing protein [Blastocatellia bacterium]|nr:zf-HC2 domain-containing protein [Blastocatellia bacterium]MBN8725403.1 zf-HC2 domain-containing protein [Acidobacteriota bacterium]
MNCDQVLPLIYDLVDADISASDKLLLEKHLASCEACQETLKSIESAEKFYKEEVLLTPASDLSDRISNQVWLQKNVVSLEDKLSPRPTKSIIYYLSAIAASFAITFYLLGSLLVSQAISKIDFLAFFTDKNLTPNFSTLGELNETNLGILNLLAKTNSLFSNSSTVKALVTIFILASLQFTLNYLLTQNKPKQDKSL